MHSPNHAYSEYKLLVALDRKGAEFIRNIYTHSLTHWALYVSTELNADVCSFQLKCPSFCYCVCSFSLLSGCLTLQSFDRNTADATVIDWYCARHACGRAWKSIPSHRICCRYRPPSTAGQKLCIHTSDWSSLWLLSTCGN